MKVIPVLLSGGSGKRLWPVSRNLKPKQFLSFNDKNSMFQDSLIRLDAIDNLEVMNPIIVCNKDHQFIIDDQMSALDKDCISILLEPIGKNTAPAIACASHYINQEINEDCLMLVMPADHLIKDLESFSSSINKAYQFAIDDSIVVFGIKPTAINTGYGYIKQSDVEIGVVESFTEKPSAKVAEEYIKQGGYFWNSGIYFLSPQVYLSQLKQFAPDISKYTKLAMQNAKKDDHFIKIDPNYFAKTPSDSIDYAVTENAIGSVPINLVELDAGWSDLGSWDSIYQNSKKDKNDNAIFGNGNVILNESRNNYIF
jgi:mannose-1-phosphate guanylyltransferase